jgi:Ser-tRNA(Ala) deacylase AlaX
MIFALQGAAKIETIQADWSVSSEVDTGAREESARQNTGGHLGNPDL